MAGGRGLLPPAPGPAFVQRPSPPGGGGGERQGGGDNGGHCACDGVRPGGWGRGAASLFRSPREGGVPVPAGPLPPPLTQSG